MNEINQINNKSKRHTHTGTRAHKLCGYNSNDDTICRIHCSRWFYSSCSIVVVVPNCRHRHPFVSLLLGCISVIGPNYILVKCEKKPLKLHLFPDVWLNFESVHMYFRSNPMTSILKRMKEVEVNWSNQLDRNGFWQIPRHFSRIQITELMRRKNQIQI